MTLRPRSTLSGARSAAPLTSRVKRRAHELGFALVGVARPEPSRHMAFYREWLGDGAHGDMGWLARPDAVARRADLTLTMDDVRSVVVVAHEYYQVDAPASVDDPSRGIIARYARGRDYHKVVKKRLLRLLEAVEEEMGPPGDGARGPREHSGGGARADTGGLRRSDGSVGRRAAAADADREGAHGAAAGEDGRSTATREGAHGSSTREGAPGATRVRGRAYVDTGPILERELASRAGLGWFGRNTMLIHPRRGSWFFLGCLLLDVELEPDPPFTSDHCGSCSRCLDACPTGALRGRDVSGAPVIDARRCISYLTIEHRGPIPIELRPLLGNRIYGCDICQEVCPFNNERFVQQLTSERDYRADWREAEDRPYVPQGLPGTDAPSLVALMRMTREEWDLWTRGSAIRRAGYAGFKRNVAVALGNWLGSVEEPPEEAVAVLREALEDESELVREHAAWALGARGLS